MEHLKSGLKERAIKSAGITLSAQVIKLLLQIASITILARLLEPTDFGLVAMVTVFTGLALHFMEGGLSIATIQSDQVTDAQISNRFWVNAALGTGLCVLGIITAPVIARIYDEPRLTLVMIAMSLTFLIGGLSVQHDAILRRQMRFKAISAIDILSMAAGILAGIVAALAGTNYWALVISPVVTFSTRTILRWITSRWSPSMMSRNSGVRSLLGFGAQLTGANFFGYVATSLPYFAVGYLGGAQPLGLFDRANTLTSIPSRQVLPPVLNVMLPTIARLANDAAALRSAITSLLGKLVLATMFVTITMAVLADWIVQLFLGTGWEGAVPVFRMLAVFSLVEPVAGFLAVCLVATGNAKALLRWKLITLLILLISIGIGSRWGAFGVVAAYALSGVFIRLPGFLFFASRYLPVTFGSVLKTMAPPIVCAVGTATLLYALRQLLPLETPLLGMVVFLSLAATIYWVLCIAFSPTRYELMEIVKLSKVLVSRNSNAP